MGEKLGLESRSYRKKARKREDHSGRLSFRLIRQELLTYVLARRYRGLLYNNGRREENLGLKSRS